MAIAHLERNGGRAGLIRRRRERDGAVCPAAAENNTPVGDQGRIGGAARDRQAAGRRLRVAHREWNRSRRGIRCRRLAADAGGLGCRVGGAGARKWQQHKHVECRAGRRPGQQRRRRLGHRQPRHRQLQRLAVKGSAQDRRSEEILRIAHLVLRAHRQHRTDVHRHGARLVPVIHNDIRAPTLIAVGPHKHLRARQAPRRIGTARVISGRAFPAGERVRRRIALKMIPARGRRIRIAVPAR